MKRLNKNGFGKIELITVLGLIAVLLAFGSKLALDTGKSYNGFKTVANNFANSVAMYKDYYTKDSNIYYLYEIIEKGYSTELSNPMSPSEYCDKYNSYIDMPQPNNKKVYLICGNYIVEGVQNKSYKVYEVGEWTDKRDEKTNDTNVLYNYKKNGETILDDYLSEKEFIQKYFEINNIVISSPFDIKNTEGTELLTKKVYRTKTLVKELK